MNKILYVDDELINLQLFEINLSRKYDVYTASDGLIALDILEKNPDIKVVISDMRMPIMNGIEFIKRAKVKFDVIKYYILTGFDITQEIEEAINSGLIVKYFRKPFNLDEIDGEINKIISSK